MTNSITPTTQLSLVPNTATTSVDGSDAVEERQELVEGGNVSPQSPTPEVDREELERAVSDISDYIQNISRELQFQLDDQIGGTIVTVLDPETDEIIRQIPSEETVEMARYIAENSPDVIKGLLVNSEG